MKALFIWLAKIAFVLFLVVNLLIACCGVSSIALTFTVYFLVAYGVVALVKKFSKNELQQQNLNILLLTLIGSLFLGELILRYVFKTHLSYEERSGGFFSPSVYDHKLLQNFIDGTLLHKSTYLRIVNEPNTTIQKLSVTEFSYTHHYNALGLRGRLPSAKPAKLIIGLGDSFTEGIGTPEDSTWIALLTSTLNNNSSDTLKYEYLNGGVIGSDPIAELEVLQELLKTYSPHTVVVAINSTDIDDVLVKGGIERYGMGGQLTSRPVPWFDFFYGFSYISRSIIHDVFRYNYFLMKPKAYENERTQALQTIVHCLSQNYIELSKKYNFKLIVVLHPMVHELEQNKCPLQSLYNQAQSITGMYTINLYNEFYKRKKEQQTKYKDYYWEIDRHHNALGYALMAQCIAAQL